MPDLNKYTENQKRAITESGNIIVSAGAGSGKTTVMIERIIDKLIHGAKLDEMLIVTFTRASAADMRIKLAEKLTALKTEKCYEIIARDALDAMPSCNIGTLHSYCQKIVRAYFYVAEFDPSTVLCDETEAETIKSIAVAESVEKAWYGGDGKYAEMYNMLCSRRNDDGIKSVITEILDFALSMPDPKAYFESIKPDEEYFPILDDIMSARRNELVESIESLKRNLTSAGMTNHVNAIVSFVDYMDGIVDDILGTRHTARYDYTDELNKIYIDLKDKCKKFKTVMTDAQNSKRIRGFEYARALADVAFDAYRRYAEHKERMGKIDYSDLEHGAYRVLSDDTCLTEIAASIKYVFIDEFQDVNPLQSAIAEKFKKAGAEMFLVGDVKQSIYGFRRCSPQHFINAVFDHAYKHISLTENFRSCGSVIDFVNSVFDGIMTKDFGGVDYKAQSERLICGNKRLIGDAEFCLIGDAGNDEISETADEEHDAISADGSDIIESTSGYSVIQSGSATYEPDPEAVFIADRIVRYIRESDKPKLGGIAVLLRSIQGEFVSALMREFESRNIKYVFGKKQNIKAFSEAIALVDILRCIDNRFDDIALYTALRSPMGGFSDAEIYSISTEGGKFLAECGTDKSKITLWQKLTAYQGEHKTRVDGFCRLREDIAEFAQSHDSADVLGRITSKIDYFQHVYENGGNARVVEALIDYAADRQCDMHSFLEHYDAVNFELSVDFGDDAVVISTIHGAKGLEYDYCIVADTAHSFCLGDMYGKILVTENGVFVKVPDMQTMEVNKTAPWIVESSMFPDRIKPEELRLFYVALTRAKQKLTVCGKAKKFDAKVAPTKETRSLHFMRHMQPSYVSPSETSLPIGDEPSDCEYNESVALKDALKARMRAIEKYNADRLDSLPIKTCVTAAARESENFGREQFVDLPVLVGGDTDSLARGTAYHRMMELLNFLAPDFDCAARDCENYELVDRREIEKAAEVMKGLTAGAIHCFKERYFTVDLPANEVYAGVDRSDGVLVQGVIDLLAIYGDGTAVIVDYKTGDPRTLYSDAYRAQLRLYTAAVEKATTLKVSRAWLYSFAAGKLIDPFDKGDDK